MRFHSASLPIIVTSGMAVDTCVVLGCKHLRAGMSVSSWSCQSECFIYKSCSSAVGTVSVAHSLTQAGHSQHGTLTHPGRTQSAWHTHSPRQDTVSMAHSLTQAGHSQHGTLTHPGRTQSAWHTHSPRQDTVSMAH